MSHSAVVEMCLFAMTIRCRVSARTATSHYTLSRTNKRHGFPQSARHIGLLHLRSECLSPAARGRRQRHRSIGWRDPTTATGQRRIPGSRWPTTHPDSLTQYSSETRLDTDDQGDFKYAQGQYNRRTNAIISRLSSHRVLMQQAAPATALDTMLTANSL